MSHHEITLPYVQAMDLMHTSVGASLPLLRMQRTDTTSLGHALLTPSTCQMKDHCLTRLWSSHGKKHPILYKVRQCCLLNAYLRVLPASQTTVTCTSAPQLMQMMTSNPALLPPPAAVLLIHLSYTEGTSTSGVIMSSANLSQRCRAAVAPTTIGGSL